MLTNILTQQMETHSTLQIKIRHSVKLLTKSSGILLDILMTNHRQLINLELPPPAHIVHWVGPCFQVCTTYTTILMHPSNLLQFLSRICAGSTTKQDLTSQDAYPNSNNTSAFLARAFRCSHYQLVSSSPFWSWQETLGKDPQPGQNLGVPLSCDRETSSGGLSTSPKLAVRFSKTGPEFGLQISFQPV